MGWLRLGGSLKLYVSFAEYRLIYRARLQKRPTILRSLLIVATPYLADIWWCNIMVQHGGTIGGAGPADMGWLRSVGSIKL